MRLTAAIVTLVLITPAIGCQHHEPIQTLPTWKRFFPDNQQLVGVKVHQHPDKGDHESHLEKHPAMVEYFFRRGGDYEVCQVGFSPAGDIEEVFWWKEPPDKSDMIGLQPPQKQ